MRKGQLMLGLEAVRGPSHMAAAVRGATDRLRAMRGEAWGRNDRLRAMGREAWRLQGVRWSRKSGLLQSPSATKMVISAAAAEQGAGPAVQHQRQSTSHWVVAKALQGLGLMAAQGLVESAAPQQTC